MDLISHGLINNLIFKSLPTNERWWAIIFGMLPDLISFSGVMKLEFFKKLLFFKKIPHAFIPLFVFKIYNITHSLVIWAIIFTVIWFLGFKIMAIAFIGWAVHIVIDIFTHSAKSFPTKIFWPLSDWNYSGFTWSSAKFLIIEYSILAILYALFYF